MVGINRSSIISIISRGFFSLFSLGTAMKIESKTLDINFFLICYFVILLFGAIISFAMSKLYYAQGHYYLYKKDTLKSLEIPALLSIFIGLQFSATIFAYIIIITYPESRLTIISLVPAFSLIGTLATIVVVEPKFAKQVDLAKENGYLCSKELLKARAASFIFSASILLFIHIYINNNEYINFYYLFMYRL